MIDILILLLKPALLWESDKLKYWYLTPVALVAWIADMIAAHTVWALTAGWPKRGEWTISHTLERLCDQWAHPDCLLFIQISKKINRVAGHAHIKAVT